MKKDKLIELKVDQHYQIYCTHLKVSYFYKGLPQSRFSYFSDNPHL